MFTLPNDTLCQNSNSRLQLQNQSNYTPQCHSGLLLQTVVYTVYSINTIDVIALVIITCLISALAESVMELGSCFCHKKTGVSALLRIYEIRSLTNQLNIAWKCKDPKVISQGGWKVQVGWSPFRRLHLPPIHHPSTIHPPSPPPQLLLALNNQNRNKHVKLGRWIGM